MKIEAFNDKWNIEVTESYVRVNGETVATGYIPTSRSNDKPTDCDGTPLEYGDRLICVKPFTCQSGDNVKVNDEADYEPQYYIDFNNYHWKEFTPSELKNFRKLN